MKRKAIKSAAVSPRIAVRPDLERRFREAEASSRLEGMDPLDSPDYLRIKAQVLAGDKTSEEALDEYAAQLKAKWAHAGTQP